MSTRPFFFSGKNSLPNILAAAGASVSWRRLDCYHRGGGGGGCVQVCFQSADSSLIGWVNAPATFLLFYLAVQSAATPHGRSIFHESIRSKPLMVFKSTEGQKPLLRAALSPAHLECNLKEEGGKKIADFLQNRYLQQSEMFAARRRDKLSPSTSFFFSKWVSRCLFLSSFSFQRAATLVNSKHLLRIHMPAKPLSSLSPPLQYNLHDRLKLNDFKLYHFLRESSKADTCKPAGVGLFGGGDETGDAARSSSRCQSC